MSELPERPNLEQLRHRAKQLLRSYRKGQPSALSRVASALPRLRTGSMPFRLAQAQAVVAREHGFASWPRLKAHIEDLAIEQPKAAWPVAVSVLRGQPPAEIAAVLAGLAGRLELEELAPRLAIGRRKILDVREAMRQDGTHGVLVDALILGVRHPNPSLRYIFAHAMDIFADERCAAALLELLDDPVPRVRRIAVHSIACDECKIVPLQPLATQAGSDKGPELVARVVHMATRDPSIQVRRHAAFALALFDDDRAVEALELLLARESDVTIRRNATAALRRLRRSQAPAAP